MLHSIVAVKFTQELSLSKYEFVELIIRLTGDGLAPYTQTVGSSLRTPWLVKSGK
jgi:hypothetical protein